MGDKEKAKGDAEGDGRPVIEDDRWEYLFNYVSKSLKIKMEKWNKMMLIEDYKEAVFNFLNDTTTMNIIFTVNIAGILTPSFSYPKNVKNKCVYFIKKEPIELTNENISEVLLFGDMSPKPLDELKILLEELITPLLTNPENQKGWPSVVIEDLERHLHEFRNDILQVKGAMENETLLPMPAGAERAYEVEQDYRESGGQQIDIKLKSSIEESIIKWSTIVNDVMKEKSSTGLQEGEKLSPLKEVQFWEKRLKTLESIYEQLRDPRVKKMASILELTESVYYPSFKILFRNVVAAVAEARDVVVHLKPLAKHFGQLEQNDFSDCRQYLKPMLHCVCLLWANSRYFCLNSKICLLLREISNSIVEECTKELDPASIFQGESEEQIKVLANVLDILKTYVSMFEEYRNKIETFFSNPNEALSWNFHPKMIFDRLLKFIERVEKIYEFFLTVIEFGRLEKVEIGGIKGRGISQKVQMVLNEFTKYNTYFASITYDPLDPDDASFDVDYQKFLDEVVDLDRKLGALFSQAYDECFNLESIFKYLKVLGSLLHRPLIFEEIEPKLKNILELMHIELDTTKSLFDNGEKYGIPIDTYMPPVAGSIFWINKLKARIQQPMLEFNELTLSIAQNEEADYIRQKDTQMAELLNDKSERVFDEWSKTVTDIVQKYTNNPVLARDGNKLRMNFDPQLDAILREIRYLKYAEIENLPQKGLEFYDRNEELYQFKIKLQRIVEWYNLLIEKCSPVELEMISEDMHIIDEMINDLIRMYTWNDDVLPAVTAVFEKTENVKNRVLQAQNNLEGVMNALKEIGQQYLFDRKNGKLLALDAKEDSKNKRYAAIQTIAEDLKHVMDDNYLLYFHIKEEELEEEEEEMIEIEEEEILISPPKSPTPPPKKEKKGGRKKSKTKKETQKEKEKIKEKDKEEKKKKEKKSALLVEEENFAEEEELWEQQEAILENKRQREEKWIRYEEHVDKGIENSMMNICARSIELFVTNTEPRQPPNTPPLFEIELGLQEPDLYFKPSIESEDEDSLVAIIEDLLNDITYQAELIPRVDKRQPFPHYRENVEHNLNIYDDSTEIIQRVIQAIESIVDYVEVFEPLKYLWSDDRKQVLDEFLKYSRQLTDEERMMLEMDPPMTIKEKKPLIEDFQHRIDFYEEKYEECEKLEYDKMFDSWLNLNMRPLRQAILNHVRKWGNMYKDYIVNHVISSLENLDIFIKEAIDELSKPVVANDYQQLVRIITYLNNIKERQVETDGMFKPITELIDLLKTYGVKFEEDIYSQLQELPDKWLGLKKLAFNVKQNIGDLHSAQCKLILKRSALFQIRQQQFRQKFEKLPIFDYNCTNPYFLLDKCNKECEELESVLQKIKDQASLFEVELPEYLDIDFVRRTLPMAKRTWDYILIAKSRFDEWKNTLWEKIDVEAMETDCKKMAKEIRQFEKEIRGWPIVEALDAEVKNMLTSLKAVTELQNPAIRDRHWKQLEQVTKVKIEMTPETTLSDLLELQLHKFEEDVKNTVDQAIKEQQMEKALKDITNNWNTMELSYDYMDKTKCEVVRPSEEIVELLEDNQVQIQNMLNSKYIPFFFDEVSDWQKKLSTADAVNALWFEVQRKWMYLESIFVGSDDIRQQLPEESKKFDIINNTFRTDLLANIIKTPNFIKATNQTGLYDKLESLNGDLIVCEKALNDYLETKRLTYPRFYFISSADLLDILSNGNSPELVQRHLTKLYDSISKLDFLKQGEQVLKDAKGMTAKDGEYVAFFGKIQCTGKVEIWLNRLTDIMRVTVNHSIHDSVYAYEEKPRDKWLFDWPAQPALVATQIWWSSEVNLSFFRMEEGFENALKDFSKKQVIQLNNLIALLLGDLTEGDRQKIMTVCTIDVHSRDVVTKMIVEKVENGGAFQWQSQLRHRWEDDSNHCFANICDAQFRFDYEYLGNTPRLVITPLTDRCYITLTQSLHLIMGGAPAGPAGTGKTETTKDLGKALGMMVYVFNCSEQMDYKSCANIYKGLAQTGAWGCFDEFNRIAVEVLSVISVQVKTILDAIKYKKKTFWFYGNDIVLIPTVGMFITMNPGYAGRAELPENLKALFRPCAMVVPDFALISEIMLVAEGFQDARLLSRKFIKLYELCRELLSKQDHYDWGLRAIKSVLVVAGSLKRSDRARPEEQVLMRALRDFNIPKIITDDVPIFMGLIGDLFPALDVPRKRDLEFEVQIKQAASDRLLQPEDGFVLKIVQLKELFAVRHSVFIIGFAGTGKSEVWRTLFKTYQNLKLKPHYNDLNPKTVTNDELFGIINPATREWKDGIVSVLIRDQSQIPGPGPKWLVLDGDIDPMWIESLNTVMDDNKVLTLASNERIALTPEMRLLFEISNLRTATPATVSRAGILYINQADLGWNPFVTSWIETRESASEKAQLIILFDKYVNPCLEILKTKLKKITSIPECAHLEMLCFLLESLLTPINVPKDCPREWYEIYFVFAAVWAFGSSMFQDQLIDWRNEFHKWWINEFKTVRFPIANTVFDYYVDPQTKKFLPWSNRVKKFELDTDIPLSSTLVDTNETSRYRFFMDLLLPIKAPIMLIGTAGTGKSVIISEKLGTLPENYLICNVPFNFYTTSEMLQRVLEKPLVKKAGRNYGPPGTKMMIYFIDDLNMPEVDTYGTVQPHTLIRQHMDYEHWYDRVKIQLKEIHNVQYVACMNPTAGSFTIDPRLQRHFCVFAVSFPKTDALMRIYTEILEQHLTAPHNKYLPSVTQDMEKVIGVVLDTHKKVTENFLPTAVKFHYIFNIRDLSNIFQGILFTTGECIKNVSDLLRVYMHEATRVYCDKLVDSEDIKLFTRIVSDSIKKGEIEDINETAIFADPLIYCHFAEGIGDPKYLPIKNWEQLSKLLNEALTNYNDLIAIMNLVLFEDAMYHLCRINRIMEAPRGNGLLIGVGGSGKQSLTRLAASISSLEVFQVQLRKGYSITDLKADFAVLYMKAGVKGVGIVFLMNDSQVADEKFLVVINDVLATGEIPELFPDDDVENIIASMRNEVKIAGIPDTRENCWKFFIDRVRKTMKITLCFSPVGSTLRIRGRKFPAVVNCTSIDWFHEWPQDALESVSKRFLSELPCLPSELVIPVSLYMSYVHTIVNQISQVYLTNEKRYNYTTPKSFLEQIDLYSRLLTNHINEAKDRINRLTNGLEKLRVTAGEVAGLKEKLAAQEIELIERNKAAEDLIKIVSEENEKVGKEKEFAASEEKKVRVIEEDVTKKAKSCAEDLRKAEPALKEADEALETLKKGDLTELKSFATPPDSVILVCSAVLILTSKTGRVPKDISWKAAKAMMSNVGKFKEGLMKYKKDNMPPEIVKVIKQQYINNPRFNPDAIKEKSFAAYGLALWVINIIRYHDVFVVVEPKRKALLKANQELKEAQTKLFELKLKLEQLEEQLANLKSQFDSAVEAKIKCQQEADETALTIDLANRLVNGLASENVRWKASVISLNESINTLPGDILQVTAFISYVGCFTRKYRGDLINKYWEPFIDRQPIPKTPDLDPLTLLTDDAQIAQWNNEGLPSDRMSTENATILTNSSRWPLMIDPQLQGIKWIKTKYGDDLIVLRLTMKNYLDRLERAIVNGETVLLENIGEMVDAVLDPLLGRVLIKKGKVLKMGDKEVDFNTKFRLILHTKLANPHYRPEMQAQCTLINFTVTKDGLEEQLLAEVVKAERPDLELLKSELTKQNNNFKITLKNCEANLLLRLSSASGNILGDVALVENLETTKKTAAEIKIKVEEAKITTLQIDEAREAYRPAGARSSLLYFVLNDLQKINPIYQFSLKAFSAVFARAIENSIPDELVTERVKNLIDNITFSVFLYTNRSLFEKDKLIFLSHLTIQILAENKECPADEIDFLFRMPITPCTVSPLDFLSVTVWGAVKSLSNLAEFQGLGKDIEGSWKRWKKFVNSEAPEHEKLPSEWKNKTPLQQLCIMRALRPDRITYAVKVFVDIKIGKKYIETHIIPFPVSYSESSAITPIFFILSPGVDPMKDVEKLGHTLGYSTDNQNFHNVSLGQGQEEVAESAMDLASKEGHWVLLQNIHLVERWLPSLDKKMEQVLEGVHDNYRLFISAEPAPDPAYNKLPQGVLESSIKITNEPPTGMAPNLHAAFHQFTEDTLEMSSKDTEFRAILFSLCYFHAVVAERRKFGAQGWNRVYPFNVGDLTICVYVLYNYLEINPKVPWEDLRYLFGEIMYGGHITDDWDRKLCRTFLEEYMNPDLIETEVNLAPGFLAPPTLDYQGYLKYIDENLPQETPYLYGLHPNAEIGFLTTVGEVLFKTLFELQPRDAGASTQAVPRDEKIRTMLEDFMDKLPDLYNMTELYAKVEDLTPYTIVAFQECERMNNLVDAMKTQLKEVELGLKGELTITKAMEDLQECLFMDVVPPAWEKLAYPSLLPLGGWFADLTVRMSELTNWTSDFSLPPTIWLAGFFNPQSLLTAIMQQTARKNEWPLDRMVLNCDVTKRNREDFTAAPREGAYIYGLIMEGARWDTTIGSIVESNMKELFPQMPVVFIRAVTQDKQDTKNVYECPVYKTRLRGPTFVWKFNLRTKAKASKWILAGVALILQI